MIYAYLVLQLAMFLLSLGGYFQVKMFLGLHHEITQPTHLNKFKGLVRMNMYMALLYICIGVPGILISIYLGFAYGLLGVVAVTGINVLQLLFAKHVRSLEEKVRRLQCSH